MFHGLKRNSCQCLASHKFIALIVNFFWGWNFTKFLVEKYDFNPYQGFFMEKGPNLPSFEEKKSKLLNFYEKLH
jgi:hypothetical protein